MNQTNLKSIVSVVLNGMFFAFLAVLFQPEMQVLAEIIRGDLFRSFVIMALCIVMACVVKLTFSQG